MIFMMAFKEKKIIFYFLLSLVVFFIIPTGQAMADPITYGCPNSRDGDCRDIIVDLDLTTFELARAQCPTGNLMRTPCFVPPIPVPSSNPGYFGCPSTNETNTETVCTDIPECAPPHPAGFNAFQEALEGCPAVFRVSCSGLNMFGCAAQDGGCQNVFVDPGITTFENARQLVQCQNGTLMKRPCFGFVQPPSPPPFVELNPVLTPPILPTFNFGCIHNYKCNNIVAEKYANAIDTCLKDDKNKHELIYRGVEHHNKIEQNETPDENAQRLAEEIKKRIEQKG